MTLHFAIAMQLVCNVASIFTNTGVPSKLGWGQLSEFHARSHAAAYAVEEWYWLHQSLACVHVMQVSHSKFTALQLHRHLHCTCIALALHCIALAYAFALA